MSLQTPSTEQKKTDRNESIAVGATMLALAGMCFAGFRESGNALTTGELVRVASKPETHQWNDGGFPRSGGLLKVNAREVWTFTTDTGKTVALDRRSVPSLSQGDTVRVLKLDPVRTSEIRIGKVERL